MSQFFIDKLTIDQIMDAAQIKDVVADFVSLRRRGVNYVGLCPFHDDSSPSFYVSPAKNICKCFACGEGGSAVHFIMKHEQLGYYESLKWLAKKYNIEIQERELTDEQKKAYNERESLFIVNEYARDYFSNILHNHLEGKSVGLSYFKERGFREDTIKKFQLGYGLEERDAFTKAALQAGYQQEYLTLSGLCFEGDNNYVADRFRGRAIFPVHTLSGKVVAFGGRILDNSKNLAKYVNSPESTIYSKSAELYGIYFAKQAMTKADSCYLVEGYTDVISMHQAGIENVVSSSGTALTKGQIRMIHRFTKNVTVLYDGDAAGIKAALRGIDLLLEDGLNVKVVLLPDGEDPDSFSRKQNADSFSKFMKENEVDFIQFKTRLLLDEAGKDPIKRAALITDIVESIAVIPDNIVRSIYIKDCSLMLNVDERVLVNEVNKKKINQSKQQSSRPVQKAETAAKVQDKNENTPATEKKKYVASPIDKYEKKILYYIVRFGMHKLVENAEDKEQYADEMDTSITVLKYVKLDLERDQLWFNHPIYKQMLDEAIENMNDKSFLPSKYFLSHTDARVSRLTANIISDIYELSKIHIRQFGENFTKQEETPLAEEKHLIRSVPRVLTELKNAYIVKRMDEVRTLMKEEQDAGNWDATIELAQEMQALKEVHKVLAKVLGEQIIIGW